MFPFLAIVIVFALARYGANEPALWLTVAILFASGFLFQALYGLRPARKDTPDNALLVAAALVAALTVFVDPKLALGPMAGICAWTAARRHPNSLGRFFHILLAIGVFEAMLALFQHFVAPGWIFGYLNPTYAISGTLINRNHFAGLMGMLIPVAVGMAYTSWVRYRDPARTYLYLLAGSFMGLALAFSLSRMGIVSFLVTLGVLSMLVRWIHSGRLGSVFVLVPLFLILTGAAWIGTDVIVERFEGLLGPDGTVQDARPVIFEDTLRMIVDRPMGVGVGGYADAFRRYQTAYNNLLFDHAHNDYLETAAEWGIPLAVTFWAWIFFVFLRSVRAFLGRGSLEQRGVLLAAIGAILSILVHSLVDFNLQIPSNAMLFATFVGIAIATTRQAARVAPVRSRSQSSGLPRDRSENRARSTTGVSPEGRKPGRRRALAHALISVVLFTAVISRIWGPLVAADLTAGTTTDPAIYEKALEYDPDNARYHFVLGQIYDSSIPHLDRTLALGHYRKAVELNPNHTAYWLELSRFYEDDSDGEDARAAMTRALEVDPNDAATYWAAANMYVRLGDPQQADRLLARTAQLDPSYVQPVLDLTWNLYQDPERIMATHVPDTRDANLIALQYFVTQSNEQGASLAWERARRFEPTPAERLGYVNFLVDRGQPHDAYAIFLTGSETNTTPPPFFNPSLEAEPMNGGFDWTYSSEPAEVRRDTTQSHDGMASLMIEFRGEENVSYAHVSHLLAVTSGKAYELTFWMRTEGISTDQGVYVEIDGQRSEMVLGTTFWQEFTIPFVASSDLVTLRVRRNPSQRFDNLLMGKVWFDAFELRAL